MFAHGNTPADPMPEGNAPSHINIKVVDQGDQEVFFKIKNTTELGKVLDAYCERTGNSKQAVRFLFEGSRVQDTDTPEGLEMEEGCQIDAVLEQFGGASAESAEESKQEVTLINVKVKDQSNNEILFKIRTTTPLSKVMNAYCNSKEVDRGSVRFLFDGERVIDNDTPTSKQMEDQDEIQVFVEQTGGADAAEAEAEGMKPMDEDHPKISITCKDSNSQEITFRIKKVTPLKRVMDAYCQQQGRAEGSLRFFAADGCRVQPNDTPLSLEMKEGEVLDVLEEQLGGFCF